ncbi:MAG: hypothetical protein Q9166_006417 [cf. Caloplaca sp. 2 TL-2023]
MGHIPALGAEWIGEAMDTFLQLYQRKRTTYFPSSSESWVVLGIAIDDKGDKMDWMDDTSRIIFDRLTRAHLDKDDPGYPFPKFDQEQYYFHLQNASQSPLFPGKGSVFVDTSDGQLIVYVEDRAVRSS